LADPSNNEPNGTPRMQPKNASTLNILLGSFATLVLAAFIGIISYYAGNGWTALGLLTVLPGIVVIARAKRR
jgi:hypothetical protein